MNTVNNDLPSYVIMDPTGNITVLATEYVDPEKRRKSATDIMNRESAAEQLGFLYECSGADIALEMAGGEFCGNATMSAAAYYASKNGIRSGMVVLKVSGADEPVAVELEAKEDGSWFGTVEMPAPESVEMREFSDGAVLPVVHLPGADHVIVEITERPEVDARAFYEEKIKTYSSEMKSLCAGMMIYDRENGRLDPLVYVSGIDSLFWEHSCASGTTAVGAWEAFRCGKSVSLCLHEPGGSLTVKVSNDNKYLLSGSVRFLNS